MIHSTPTRAPEIEPIDLLSNVRSLAYALNDVTKEIDLKGSTSLPVTRADIQCLAASAAMLLHALPAEPAPEAPKKLVEQRPPLAWKPVPFWHRLLWIVS